MNLIHAIKNTEARMVFEDKWLIYEDNHYKVMQRKRNAKITKVLIDTVNQEDAVSVLLIQE